MMVNKRSTLLAGLAVMLFAAMPVLAGNIPTGYSFQTVISPSDPAFTQLLGINNSGTSTLVFNATSLIGTMAALFNVQGVIQVDDGGTLEVVGATNATTLIGNVSGQINIGGTGAGGTIKLDGSDAAFSVADFGVPGGTVTLSDNSNNLISGVTGTETLINDIGETLSGTGTIKNLAFANFGTTIANGINPLLIAPNSGGFTNTGTVTVDAGSFLGLDATASATAGTNGPHERRHDQRCRRRRASFC